MRWELAKARVLDGPAADKHRLVELLADGWEPFAAVGDVSYQTLFLRRPVADELHPEGT